MPKPPKSLSFSHLGIFVNDLDKVGDFYKRLLGFVETDRGLVRGLPILFLSRNPDEHHQLALVEGRTGSLDDLVINQISLRVDTLGDLRELHASVCADAEASDIKPVSHGNAWSIYFRDPENNRIEIFTSSPWYVEQPMLEPLDLSLSDDEIVASTHAMLADNPTLKPAAEWRAAFAQELAEALD